MGKDFFLMNRIQKTYEKVSSFTVRTIINLKFCGIDLEQA